MSPTYRFCMTQITALTIDQTSAPTITNAPATIPMACTGCFSTSKNHAVKRWRGARSLRTVVDRRIRIVQVEVIIVDQNVTVNGDKTGELPRNGSSTLSTTSLLTP